MPVVDDFARLQCTSIKVAPDRQRSSVAKSGPDWQGLLVSISQNGVIQPIIVERDLTLVAGERRLMASVELGLETIPVRFADDLDPLESQIIELEENLKRSDLPWRDAVRAIGRIHELYVARTPEWSQQQTAQAIGMTPAGVSIYLKVFKSLANPKLATASGLAAAYNLLAKSDQRVADTAMSELLEAGTRAFGPDQGDAGHVVEETPQAVPVGAGNGLAHGALRGHDAAPPPRPVKVAPVLPPESILNEDFRLWAPHYAGPKFNFIHCDFPYGINAFDGSQAAAGTASSSDMGPGVKAHQKLLYDDSPESYWSLIECLCRNLDRLMAHSGHLLFWFSMKYYHETLERFQALAPDLDFNPMPLVWVKSDNRGVLPDAKRGPRQIYETALLASREDRLIVKSVSNAYSAPSDKTYHHSTKPEPVLRYFMSMLVDDTTSMLDPTCGSGSALRAAESLGARHTLGLEIDPEHCENAKAALRKFRALRGAPR